MHQPERRKRAHVHQLEALGYKVTIGRLTSNNHPPGSAALRRALLRAR